MTPELTFLQIRHFVLVVNAGSFQAAAKRAFRTQPAISLSVKELERKLGEPLFEKTGKSELTPFGHYCFPRFRSLLEHYDRVAEDVTLVAQKRSGRVSIAAVPSVASRLLPEVMQRFLVQYPDIEISVQDDTAQAVQTLVRTRHVDFGIANFWQRDTDLSFQPLWRDPIGLVCRDDHPLAADESPLPWQALSGHTLINNGTTRLLIGTAAEEWVEGSPLYVSNMISLIAMLEAGVAATTLPYLAWPQDKPNICFLPLTEPEVEREVGLLQPRGSTLSPAAKALRDLVVATTEHLQTRPK